MVDAKLKLVDDAGYWRHIKHFYITPIRYRDITVVVVIVIGLIDLVGSLLLSKYGRIHLCGFSIS